MGFPVNHDLPRTLRAPAVLSGFLTGITTPDPVVPSTQRTFADLARRQADLEALLVSFGPAHFGLGPIEERHMPTRVHFVGPPASPVNS